jgi:membrane-associated protease RseP (regulator of RpoE activity)
MNLYLLIAIVVALYLDILLIGHLAGTWKRLGVSLYGPVMMLRTARGQGLIERLAKRRRAWRAFGSAAVFGTVASMAVLTAFLLVRAYQGVVSAEAGIEIEFPPADQVVIAIYVVFGFAVAILVHEYAHGIMAIVGRMRIRSMGILLFVIPIGAFVEPHEEDLKSSPRADRIRLYSAGVASNMLLAGFCFAVLVGSLTPAAQPVAMGAIVTEVAPDSPAAIYGMKPWSEVFSIEGQPVLNATQLYSASFAEPGAKVSVHVIYRTEQVVLEMPGGIVVTEVYEGPAFDAGLMPGMIISRLNDTVINTLSEFRSVTENSSHYEPVNITVLTYGYDPSRGEPWFVEDPSIRTISLASKWVYYYTHFRDENREEYRNVSFMAVSAAPLGITVHDPEYLTDVYTLPFEGPGGREGFIGLPFIGYWPVTSPASDLYEPTGIYSLMPADVYWALVNMFYWLFWVNLMLGLTNALPAIPFDGGYLLRDLLKETAHRLEQRFSGLDRAIGRRLVAEVQIDTLMWIVSGAVLLLTLYIVLVGVFGPM